MSRWTTLPIILALSLIMLSLSAEVAAAADDDLPRNIELKPGATLPDDTTAADTSITGQQTRQIVTEPAAAADAPTDIGGKPDTPKEGEGASTTVPPPASPPAAKAAAPETPVAAPPDKATSPDAAPAGGKAPEAASVPTPPPGPSPVELKPHELALAMQTELKRVGCDPGDVDGVWGGRSREALAAFGHFAKVEVAELAPTPQILALIKGKSEVVCVASGEAPPHGESAPSPESAPPHHGGGYYGGGGY
jgi:hypothetical protein